MSETTLTVPDSPKMIRETLCVAQTALGYHPHHPRRAELAEHMARLQRLVDECDRRRPLGPDGTHGDRHTATCGCGDAPSAPPPVVNPTPSTLADWADHCRQRAADHRRHAADLYERSLGGADRPLVDRGQAASRRGSDLLALAGLVELVGPLDTDVEQVALARARRLQHRLESS